MSSNSLSAAFAQNRTEELSSDVWKHFVVPRFLGNFDLLSARKSRIIIGGRGCGKTMLLRYHSYETQFSVKRDTVPEEALKSVGLYWRIDTQFANVMSGRGIDEDTWNIAFEHFLALYVGLKCLDSLKAIGASNVSGELKKSIEEIEFDTLSAIDESEACKIDPFRSALDSKLRRFELWVSNVRKIEEPVFLPGTQFVQSIISEIRAKCKGLEKVVFHVFLDEFENLLAYQQRVINTRIKHSESPLIFSVAMKRRGFVTKNTLGVESISDIADYREFDLEHEILEADFTLFAAEVFLLNLSGVTSKDLPVSPVHLRDASCLEMRATPEYREKVIRFVEAILPGTTGDEMAEAVFQEPRLLTKLRKRIEQGLKAHAASFSAEDLIDKEFPKESIVCSALVHRSKTDPDTIASEFAKRRKGEKSKFGDWVHNNLVGCLLALYDSHDKACPFFAGFSVFTAMSKGNLRHFLELCYKSIGYCEGSTVNTLPTVSPDVQAKAARQASAAFLREIRSAGPMGNKMHTFVLRIGSLFALAHRRSSQSEPEQNHFSLRGSYKLSEEHLRFIDEAIKWTVLFEVEETKKKEPSHQHQASFEYVLNPIYAPYFNISYRKKRKLPLDGADFEALIDGNYDQVRGILNRFKNRWSVDIEDADPTLFSHLSDD